MLEILKVKAYNYIQELKIAPYLKKKFYNKYVEYMSIAYKFLLSTNDDENLLKRNLIVYDKIFKNKLLSLININEVPNDYINFIKSNYFNFKPYMLKKEDVLILNDVIKPNFNYFDYCLSFNDIEYNTFYNRVKYIALILGYEDKPNKKSSNYSDKDSSVPKNILNAIKNVE